MRRLGTVVVGMMLLCGTAYAQDPAAPAGDPNAPAAPEGTLAEGSASTATDGIRIGLGINGALPIGDASNGSGFGFGFGLRGGYEMMWDMFGLTPELVVDWNRFGGKDVTVGGTTVSGTSSWILGFKGGAKAAYHMGSIVPNFGVHFGLGHADFGGASANKLMLDVGAGADYVVSPALSVGLAVNFNMLMLDQFTANFITFGLAGTYSL